MKGFLTVAGLRSGYVGSAVLNGLDLTVDQGRILAVLGRNGVGKTTLVSTIMGLVRAQAGSIALDGQELTGQPVHLVARAGVAIVPQGRRVFAPLSVREHLRLGERAGRSGAWDRDRVLDLLPRLGERLDHRGDRLSGGEQQMLAISRALLTNPRMLLMDEPSDGLAPAIVAQVRDVLRALAADGMTILLVEQDLALATAVADRAVVIDKGQVVHASSMGDLRADGDQLRSLLGAGSRGTRTSGKTDITRSYV